VLATQMIMTHRLYKLTQYPDSPWTVHALLSECTRKIRRLHINYSKRISREEGHNTHHKKTKRSGKNKKKHDLKVYSLIIISSSTLMIMCVGPFGSAECRERKEEETDFERERGRELLNRR
jgi:hypothetical protein